MTVCVKLNEVFAQSETKFVARHGFEPECIVVFIFIVKPNYCLLKLRIDFYFRLL
jgi:hypothetical protein